MQPVSIIIFLLFFPACMGILRQAIWGTELTSQIIAIAMFFFCIEQARMAVKDLNQITEAKQLVSDIRLDNFYIVTVMTIVIELVGFYASAVWLGWGSIIILVSQVWFNLLATVKIKTSPKNIIENWKISERLPVLIADIVGLILVSVWMLKFASFWISLILGGMVVVYLSIKLLTSVNSYLKNPVSWS
ncbi:hypothetical protein [Calothrix sp. UHCC 0171]|uniref:hypothetical protein n=1 Tax=Calothrix sp. UHCC 0171 TaxID=3110245 RepID=UPI002B1F75A5|nr:hypothetical protein [Calothrix sp. UHCC 0171]MEA5571434.1 hypothetical protein [Calothrix sp. UHCC 0171]